MYGLPAGLAGESCDNNTDRGRPRPVCYRSTSDILLLNSNSRHTNSTISSQNDPTSLDSPRSSRSFNTNPSLSLPIRSTNFQINQNRQMQPSVWPNSSANSVNLRTVMLDQEEERRQQAETEYKDDLLAEEAQEEEIIRFAMELSLSESSKTPNNVQQVSYSLKEELGDRSENTISSHTEFGDVVLRISTHTHLSQFNKHHPNTEQELLSDSDSSISDFLSLDNLDEERKSNCHKANFAQSTRPVFTGIPTASTTGAENYHSCSDSTLLRSITTSVEEKNVKIDGKEVVLEMARRFLTPNDVKMIQEALTEKDAEHSAHAPRTMKSADQSYSHNFPIREIEAKTKEEYHGSFMNAFVNAASTRHKLSGRDEHNLKDAAAQLTSTELNELGRALNFASSQIKRGPPTINCAQRTYSGISTGSPTASTRLSTEFGFPSNVDDMPPIYVRGNSSRSLASSGSATAQKGITRLSTDFGFPSDIDDRHISYFRGNSSRSLASSSSVTDPHGPISVEESAEIIRAIREADELEERKSLELARQLQDEEIAPIIRSSRKNQGNVRTMTRAELEEEQRSLLLPRSFPSRSSYEQPSRPSDDDEPHSRGFRMNAANLGQRTSSWRRLDQSSVLGPNNEIRTKHDEVLSSYANIDRLGLESDDFPVVGNKAYNSFMQSVKKTKKGVETQGTGRAGSESDATKGGAMDPKVRTHITKAINNQLIERCNGVVKEGKEALVYHAEKGLESFGYDVAIKVFKRTQDFQGRADYFDGDSRYGKHSFRNAGKREQLELWTEKEFRNLLRANRAGVPVPTPLYHKENVLFMRFLGTSGWPSPQLREVQLRRGSSSWQTLYWQVVDAVKLLYQQARLVHGDLSEYNVLVVPSNLVENFSRIGNSSGEELQAVLIDFGQAVDTQHPDAMALLQRDLDRILLFFCRQGVETMSNVDALAFVLDTVT